MLRPLITVITAIVQSMRPLMRGITTPEIKAKQKPAQGANERQKWMRIIDNQIAQTNITNNVRNTKANNK